MTKADDFANRHDLHKWIRHVLKIVFVSLVINLATLVYLYHAHNDTAHLIQHLQSQVHSLGGTP